MAKCPKSYLLGVKRNLQMADNHTTFAYFYLDSAPFGYSYAINPIVNDTFTMGFIFVTVGLEPQVRVRGVRGALPVADAAGVLSCAAVDKIEEKRKPEDFVGNRNRTPAPQNTVETRTFTNRF